MADCPPNLDDGELWLPSDIFPDEVSAKISPEFPSELTYMEDLPSELTYMEDLAQQLAAFALLDRNRNAAKPPPNLERFKERSLYGPVRPQTARFGFGLGGVPGAGYNLSGSVNDGFRRAGLEQFYRYHPMKPAQAQVQSFLQTRTRVLVRPQNQGQNRFLPFQVNGVEMGGCVREYGGTGVFLPRVAATVVKKKQSVKNGEETKQKHPIKKAILRKQEQEGLQPQAGMGLPYNWT